MIRWKAALAAVAATSIGILPAAVHAQAQEPAAAGQAQTQQPAAGEPAEIDLVSPVIGTRQLQRIALIPVVVHSSEDPGYLREGLRDMLVSRLEQGGNLEVVLVEDHGRATTSVETALETGREVSADFVLFGSFTRFGQGASLDMQCAATKGVDGRPPLRQIFVHSGDIASMIPDLDELVGKVARFVNEFSDVAAVPAPAGGAPVALPIIESNGSEPVDPAADVTTVDLLRRIEALEESVRTLSSEN